MNDVDKTTESESETDLENEIRDMWTNWTYLAREQLSKQNIILYN